MILDTKLSVAAQQYNCGILSNHCRQTQVVCSLTMAQMLKKELH